MFRLGIRSKLFFTSVLLILTVGLATGVFLERTLRTNMKERTVRELIRHARTASHWFHNEILRTTPQDLHQETHRLGEATETRVTVIASDGAVIADSELSVQELGQVDNHGKRPEIVQALQRGLGISSRYSRTLNTNMVYVALPFQHQTNTGVVRVAKPLQEVDAAISRLRLGLGAVGLIGLLVAVLMSGLASHFMSRTLRSLVDSAKAIAAGTPHHRIDVTRGDELGGLAGSLNRLAEDIQSTVSTLAKERARFQTVLEGMTEAVIAVDQRRRITLMNSAALALLNMAKPPLGVLLLECIRAPALHELTEAPDRSSSTEFDLPGTNKRILAHVTPNANQQGCIIVMHDVTEVRHLETIRQDFVANVSHELRTPISVIRANAETLGTSAKNDPEYSKTLIEAIHANAERLSQLVNELLDLSQLEAGRYPINIAPIRVEIAVNKAIESLQQRATNQQIQFAISVADWVVCADKGALDQILINLLDNAIKHTPAAGTVEIVALSQQDQVRIEIRDQGPGIPEQHRGRIFERFYRVDPGRSRDLGGTGLGLSIVKHLVEKMGGSVGMSPRATTGSVFWVMLPGEKK